MPVLAHLDGINHVYVDASADPAMAAAIVVDAKMRRTGVCGAMETLLIDRGYREMQALVERLMATGCEVRGDVVICSLVPGSARRAMRIGTPNISARSRRSR